MDNHCWFGIRLDPLMKGTILFGGTVPWSNPKPTGPKVTIFCSEKKTLQPRNEFPVASVRWGAVFDPWHLDLPPPAAGLFLVLKKRLPPPPPQKKNTKNKQNKSFLIWQDVNNKKRQGKILPWILVDFCWSWKLLDRIKGFQDWDFHEESIGCLKRSSKWIIFPCWGKWWTKNLWNHHRVLLLIFRIQSTSFCERNAWIMLRWSSAKRSFFLPRGWRKGSQSYPLGCLNRSTRTIFVYGFFIWLKFVTATWWVRWVVDFYPTKGLYREESGMKTRDFPHTQGWTQATFYHQIAFFCVDSSNNVNKHCRGLFFFPCGKFGIPIGIHSWWNFHEKLDHLGW